MRLNFSPCESYFIYGSPQLQECSSSEVLSESLGTLVSSSGFWLTALVFSKCEAAESSVQPLSYSLLLRFASSLSCDSYKSATATEGRQCQVWGSLLCPSFLFRILAPVIFFSPVLWDCQKLCSASQPLSLVWLMKQPVSGGEKQLGISDSLMCIPLLSRTSAFKSWLHWELSSTLNQIVLLCLIHLFELFLAGCWSDTS